ncbi:translocon-associated protein subunit beta-like [Limulus polyphemus]|uniref:Translocon-associated protein subunit beta n=1 Tax=Limulus polyphemus TaxID=6850 RepID=A0ABM1BFC0_LIMPO|nr:translocon-associated protein subunit beta-like [Limulus polyphemus]
MFFRYLCAVVLLVAACGVSSGEDETVARLLVHKRILNRFLVEGKDLVVDYNIYNVGGSAALDVHIVDNGFPEDDFEVVIGMLKIKLDRVGPGNNVTHTVVVRPRSYGFYNFTAAEVTYLPSEVAQDVQIGYTSEPGEGGIAAIREFDRKFSPHVMDWIAFAVMTLPSLGIPLLLWYGSKSKYEAIIKQSKKH